MRKSWKFKKQNFFRLVTTMLLGIFIMTGLSTKSYAAPKQMSDGNIFDAEFYAANYPDVVAVLGNDETALYNHFLNCGSLEGRLPYDVNVDQTLTNQNVVKPMINQVTPSIKVSDFKFLGYSINENHYYEWKAALGYTGNAALINDVNLGTHIYCSSNEYNTRVALGDPYKGNNIIAAYHWITSNEFVYDGGYNSNFVISFKYKRLPVYDGPIVYGMTFDEVKQIVGYNDALSVENGTYRICTLNDGSNVLIDAVGHNEIIVECYKFEIHLWFFNDIIEHMSISFPL